jgi:hypothetical protein
VKKNKPEIKQKKTGVKYERPEIKSRGTIKQMYMGSTGSPTISPTAAPTV